MLTVVGLSGATGGAIAVAASGSSSGSDAGAAAGQYCPQLRSCSPPTVPPGFSSVVKKRTVTSKGGGFRTRVGGGTVTISVPRNATRQKVELEVTRGSASTVRKDLPRAYRNAKIVASFGIRVRRGSTSVGTSKPVTVSFVANRVARGDVVLVYSSTTGKFTKLKGAVIRNGKVVVRLTRGKSLAIVAPAALKHKHKHGHKHKRG
jgi:hypothetical protein